MAKHRWIDLRLCLGLLGSRLRNTHASVLGPRSNGYYFDVELVRNVLGIDLEVPKAIPRLVVGSLWHSLRKDARFNVDVNCGFIDRLYALVGHLEGNLSHNNEGRWLSPASYNLVSKCLKGKKQTDLELRK